MSAPASRIELTERPHAALFFDVLSAVDLGADAANLYRRRWQAPSWAGELARQLRGRPEAAQLQALPLVTRSLDELCHRLERYADRGTLDPALVALLIEVFRTESEPFLRLWDLGRPARAHRRGVLAERWTEDLRTLRLALYPAATGDEQVEDGFPRLVLLDVPALGRRARATGDSDERVVATSFAEPEPHLLAQVFHEEVHVVTDPIVRARFEGQARSTHADDPGFALHRALEEAAVEHGDEVFATALPPMLPAYRAWRSSVGMPFRAPR